MLEAVEASQCNFFENWLMKHKWVTLVTMQPEIYYQNSQSFYPSELFTLDHITMRHPVLWLIIIKNLLLFLEIFAIFHSQLSLASWYDRLDTASSFNSDQTIQAYILQVHLREVLSWACALF